MKSVKIRTILILMIVSFLVTAFIPDASVIARNDPLKGGTSPVLKSPHGTILDTTPTYKWNEVISATKYHIQVWKGSTKVFDKYPGSGICVGTSCTATPTYTLGYEVYKWRARAYISGVWKEWSPYMTFSVSPPSFTSNFTMSYGGWAKKTGSAKWNLYDGYFYTVGTRNQFSTAYFTKGQYTNFDYSARIRRLQDGHGACILVRMGNKVGYIQEWYPGYSFCFTNHGTYWVRLTKDDGTRVEVVDSRHSDKIIEYDWNILRVVAKGNRFWFYINGTFVGIVTNSNCPMGYVGVMLYLEQADYGEIQVDWAKLTVIPTPQ